MNNKVLLYSTGNYIQNLAITYNGKESEKEYISIYITESPWCVCVCVCVYIFLLTTKKDLDKTQYNTTDPLTQVEIQKSSNRGRR